MENRTIQLLLDSLVRENTIMAQCRDSIEQARLFYWQEVERLKRLQKRNHITFDAFQFVCIEEGVPEEDAMNAFHNMIVHEWIGKGLIEDATEIEVGDSES